MNAIMSTVLVTGGAGFIGSCFVRTAIARKQARIANLDALTYAGNLDSLEPVIASDAHVFIQADITDRPAVDKAFAEHRPSAVVHFAAESHVDRSIDNPSQFVVTNVLGSFHLLDAAPPLLVEARRARKKPVPLPARLDRRGLRFAGSHGPFQRGDSLRPEFALFSLQGLGRPPRPRLPSHLRAAGAGDQLFQQLRALPVPGKTYSADDSQRGRGEETARLRRRHECPRLAVRRGPLPGLVVRLDAGPAGRDLQHRRQLRALEYRDRPPCLRLVDELRPGLPHAPSASLITYVKDRPGHDRRYAIDAGKISRELGWKPEHDFQSGLRRTVAWYLDNPRWVQRVQSGKYRRERLGLGKDGEP